MVMAPTDRRPFPFPTLPAPLPISTNNEVVDRATHGLLDGNGDGNVAKDEWKKAGWTADRFKLFDANNDGQVSEKEFTQSRRFEREFNAKDQNGDGLLSRPEFEGIRRLIGNHFDSVGKGLIEGAEKASDLVMRCMPPMLKDRFASADKDGDGNVSKAEFFASRQKDSFPIRIWPGNPGPIKPGPWNLEEIKPTLLKGNEA